MSGGSIGTIVGGVVGAVAGYFVPGVGVYNGAMMGMAVGGGVGTALDPPKGPDNNGPRLNDLTVQTSTYGAFLPRAYSTIAMWGNIFWLENGKLKEVATKAQSGGKGMGGMMGGSSSGGTTYSYYATFALGLLDRKSEGRPIIGIRRITIGPKVIYDAGSDDYATLIASNQAAEGWALYLGTEDQMPDPRMQASLGAANVPGYRGRAYIVFYDLPMADHGNSLVAAQIKVDVVCSGTKGHVLESMSTTSLPTTRGYMASNGNYVYVAGYPSGFQIWDVVDPASPVLVGSVATETYPRALSVVGAYLYLACDGNNKLQIFNIVNPVLPVLTGSVNLSYKTAALAVDGAYAYVTNQGVSSSVQIIDVFVPSAPVLLATIATDTDPVDIFIREGLAYVLNKTGATLQIIDISTPGLPAVTGSIAIRAGSLKMVVNGDVLYIVGFSTVLDAYSLANPISPSLISSTTINGAGGVTKTIAATGGYICVTAPYDANEIQIWNVEDPSVLLYVGAVPSYGDLGVSELVFIDNYIYATNANGNDKLEIHIFIDGTIQSSTVPLGDIVKAEALTSNLLTEADLDVSLLTSPVRGYRIANIGSIRGGIEPLQGAWPFDVIQHGYQIKFVPRGQSSVVTIPADQLDARAAGSKPGVQITNFREMDSILPKKVAVKYFDIEREYDSGEQSHERINTDAVNTLALDMAIVFNATEAAGKAQVLLYLYWMERYDIAFSLPPEYGYLEPSDVITITSDQANYILRLTAISYTSDGRLECKAKYNDAAVYVPTAVGESGRFTGVSMIIPGNTLYQLLDIPLIQDVYDSAGFPVAMTGNLSSWPGGTLFRSVDNGQSWDSVQGFTPPGSTIGVALTALSAHGGTVLDKSGVLSVRLYQGTLSSVTEAQMFAGSNWFAYGADTRWEIIAAQKCVLQGDDSYVLTDFLRGQFGTEWATGLHAAGDSLVHLSSSELAFVGMNLASIGVEADYRGITNGSLIDSDTDTAFTYRGVNLECLSPCHFTGNRHPSTNDWTLSWTRRTRFAGWRDSVDATLGETTESYEVDIFSDNTYATVKRTLTATTSTVAYTSAQQVTDFGSNQATLYVKIYQLSATVGRGYPLIATLTR